MDWLEAFLPLLRALDQESGALEIAVIPGRTARSRPRLRGAVRLPRPVA
jgi:hypothetical protein